MQTWLSHLVARGIPWIFEHMSFLIPAKRLYETDQLVAFFHPKPAYPLHILIVPKKAIRGLTEVGSDDKDFLLDLFQCVHKLVGEYRLEGTGYRLIANGGKLQEIKQLHFHLIAEHSRDDHI